MAGAWRSAPLLPWQVQCPVGVCAAVTARQGGGAGSGSRLPVPCAPHGVGGGCAVWVSLLLACWYTIRGGLCLLRARSGWPFGAHRVSVVCSCARAPAVLPPPRRCCACTSRGFHAGRCYARYRWSVPLHVLCSGPLLRLCCVGEGSVPVLPSRCLVLISQRPIELALFAVGAAEWEPGGAPGASLRGVQGWAFSHPRPAILGT